MQLATGLDVQVHALDRVLRAAVQPGVREVGVGLQVRREQHLHRHAAHAARAATEQRFGRVVDEHHAAAGVDYHHRAEIGLHDLRGNAVAALQLVALQQSRGQPCELAQQRFTGRRQAVARDGIGDREHAQSMPVRAVDRQRQHEADPRGAGYEGVLPMQRVRVGVIDHPHRRSGFAQQQAGVGIGGVDATSGDQPRLRPQSDRQRRDRGVEQRGRQRQQVDELLAAESGVVRQVVADPAPRRARVFGKSLSGRQRLRHVGSLGGYPGARADAWRDLAGHLYIGGDGPGLRAAVPAGPPTRRARRRRRAPWFASARIRTPASAGPAHWPRSCCARRGWRPVRPAAPPGAGPARALTPTRTPRRAAPARQPG